MKMSLQALKNNSIAYGKNFKLLVKAVGTPDHAKYLEVEQELQNKSLRLLADMEMGKDPCKMTRHYIDCKDCTGVYVKRNVIYRGRPAKINAMVDVSKLKKEDEYFECFIKFNKRHTHETRRLK